VVAMGIFSLPMAITTFSWLGVKAVGRHQAVFLKFESKIEKITAIVLRPLLKAVYIKNLFGISL
jgi:hypothetical protein